MRKEAGEYTLLFAVLLAAASLHLSTAFSKGEAPLAPDIERLYDAGQYRQAAEALRAALEPQLCRGASVLGQLVSVCSSGGVDFESTRHVRLPSRGKAACPASRRPLQ